MSVDQGLDAQVQGFAVGQQAVQVYLSQHGAQGRLRKL